MWMLRPYNGSNLYITDWEHKDRQMSDIHSSPEETLDPQDWDSMRALGHRMVDDMVTHMQALRDRPVWRHAPEEIKAHFRTPFPEHPQAPDDIYAEFLEKVLRYPLGNDHPRFWGGVFGTGTMMGAYAEFLSAVMNANSGDFDHHSAIHVETQVINWLKEMLGYPEGASGLLTSGCSVANLMGLAVARNVQAGFELRKVGFQDDRPKMVLYASREIHSSIQKSVELLGLGSEALRYIEADERFRMDLQHLQAEIVKDREAGHRPFCVVGAAGTVNTGATDDLEALADICQAENLWFHVDGAFGAWAAITPDHKGLVVGMERADSLAFDLHKWMYMPFEIGCVLVRHAEEHHKTFTLTPEYLEREIEGRGLTGGDLPWLTEYDFHLSRSFRALKAWMSFKEHGVLKYGRLIQQNIDQVRYLGELIVASPDLELAVPVELNVVCFRYLKPGLDEDGLDALNKEIVVELQEQGKAVISGTTIHGKYVLRVGHTNHRSRREDFNLLVEEVIRIGEGLG
jgi:glutamate/tyrosine decarboxylase-like PLP-dependent enzyme